MDERARLALVDSARPRKQLQESRRAHSQAQLYLLCVPLQSRLFIESGEARVKFLVRRRQLSNMGADLPDGLSEGDAVLLDPTSLQQPHQVPRTRHQGQLWRKQNLPLSSLPVRRREAASEEQYSAVTKRSQEQSSKLAAVVEGGSWLSPGRGDTYHERPAAPVEEGRQRPCCGRG